MMWAVLAAALAAVFLLGGLCVGLRGSTPGDGGGLAPDRTCGGPNLSQTGRKKAGSSKRDGAGQALRQEEAPPDLFCPDRACWSWDAGCSPCCWRRRGSSAESSRSTNCACAWWPGPPDPADAALRYGQANALLGAIWQPVTRVFHVKDGWARVEVDFERTEPALYGRVSLSLTVGELAALGLSFGVKALSVLLAVRREDRQRTGQKQNAAV